MIDDMQHAGEDDVDGATETDVDGATETETETDVDGATETDVAGATETDVAAQTWIDRLIAESVEMSARLRKLRTFMGSVKFDTLPWLEKDALNRQSQHMAAYVGVLDERLSRIPDDDPANPEVDAPAVESVDDDAEA